MITFELTKRIKIVTDFKFKDLKDSGKIGIDYMHLPGFIYEAENLNIPSSYCLTIGLLFFEVTFHFDQRIGKE